MKLIGVVILVGSQCLSPVEARDGMTEASKVQCAVLIRQDPSTEAVEIIPPAAATDPDVIAMLVKPKPDVTPAETSAAAAKPKLRPVATSARKKTTARRNGVCGSYKAVWYTNKYGRRKYRCVRAG